MADGKRNSLEAWNRNGARYPEIDEKVASFEAGLRAQIPEPTAVKEALIMAARGLYASILLTQRHILAPYAKMKRTGVLYVNLPTLSSNFLRTLRALGVIGDPPEEDEDDGLTFAERCERFREQRAREKEQAAP